MLNARFSARRQRGLSLVELMVGITVGLFVVAAASTLVSVQLADNRRLLLETQLQQDLRATADIIGRELRRAGSAGGVEGGYSLVWRAGSPSQENGNLLLSPVPGSPDDVVEYRSSRTRGQDGPYRFFLEDGAIRTDFSQTLGPGVSQELTDSSTMNVTRFRVTAQNEAELPLVCQKLCADGTQNCWPTIAVRSFLVEITGQSKTDLAVSRTVNSVVRLRNDAVRFRTGDATRACPS